MDILLAAEAAGGSGGGAGYWHLALILMAIGFLGFFARWRKRRRPPAPAARELLERDHEPDRYRSAADKAIVELLETGRELTAQVDNKIRILNRLVKDAEEHSRRLEKLLAEAGRVDAVAAAAPAPPPPPAPEPEAPPAAPGRTFLSELHERIFRLHEEGRTVAEIAKATNLSTTEVVFALKAMGESHG